MADEIPGQNVIRVVMLRASWMAYIGPDPKSGINAGGFTPLQAIKALHGKLERARYVFDASWQPKD